MNWKNPRGVAKAREHVGGLWAGRDVTAKLRVGGVNLLFIRFRAVPDPSGAVSPPIQSPSLTSASLASVTGIFFPSGRETKASAVVEVAPVSSFRPSVKSRALNTCTTLAWAHHPRVGFFRVQLGRLRCSERPGTRKMAIHAPSRWSQVKLWWKSETPLMWKSIVGTKYRGERPIELSSSWFPLKKNSG